MNAAERFGWTLDDLHERIGACEVVAEAVATLDEEDEETWTASASLAFLRLADELLAVAKEVRLPVAATILRRIRRLDERLLPRQVIDAASRLRAWLQQQERELPPLPSLDTTPLGGLRAGDVGETKADNLVSLPQSRASDEKEKLRGLRTEKWVAIPARGDVGKRVRAVREALAGLSLILSAANAQDLLPFGTLDRKRLALVADAARATLAGPLAERGLLKALRENAAVIEKRGGEPAVRATGKRVRIALEILLSDLT